MQKYKTFFIYRHILIKFFNPCKRQRRQSYLASFYTASRFNIYCNRQMKSGASDVGAPLACN
jgi:hypothetical protein